MARERAGRISDISFRGWWKIARRVVAEFGRHDMTVSASAISFLALFAMFSAISAFVAFYGLFSDPATVVNDMKNLRGFAPADVVISMIGQMHSVAIQPNATLIAAGIFSTLICLWCAQQGVATLMVALNTAYYERMTDSALKHLVKSLLIAIGVIVGLIIAALLAIALPIYAQIATGSLWVSESVRAGGMGLAGLLLFLGLAALYRWVPDRRPPRWRWAGAGALLVVGFWTVASLLFSVFLAYANSYTAAYGSLSGVVLLLTLTYVTVVTVLVGAEFNAQLEYHTRADTTTAGDRPMGQRGAYVADHLPRKDPERPDSTRRR